jgi:translation initiation factor IF-2
MARKKKNSQQPLRPPVVVVLGHVDHGKTTLLSKIKEIDLTRSEFGGITQHIGAYQIKFKDKVITFIDTPGHAAFSAMRSRGAKVADLAVLVVAADEGVKPQTLESLKYIKKAKIPYLVAINKTDLSNLNLETLKKQLAENKIMVESEGGDIVCLEVSAKNNKGIDDLLEMILLLAEMQELKGDAGAGLEAVVIESKLDSRRGILATILIRNGSLKVGDQIKTKSSLAKIKAMFDENRRSMKSAGPSRPVEIFGFKTVPLVGDLVKRTKKKVLGLTEKPKEKLVQEEKSEEKKLRLIIKADVIGTLEAILDSLPKNLEVIDSGVGEINESDVLLAVTVGAEIIAFNLKVSKGVKKLAETEKIKISDYQIIYKLFEEIEEKIKKLTEPDEEILGKAEILKEFEIDKRKIAGCRILEGEIKKTDKFHLTRQDRLIGNCRFKSMKQGKNDIRQAKAGEEFGAALSPTLDFNLGDVLVSYKKTKEND